jgi:MFS family permease
MARLGVGVGEAGGVAPAYSLIADYFPPHQRARALSIYSFGIPIGSALGIVFGGLIASKIDWRFAFFAVGLAGIVLAPIFPADRQGAAARPFRSRARRAPATRACASCCARWRPSRASGWSRWAPPAPR